MVKLKIIVACDTCYREALVTITTFTHKFDFHVHQEQVIVPEMQSRDWGVRLEGNQRVYACPDCNMQIKNRVAAAASRAAARNAKKEQEQ